MNDSTDKRKKDSFERTDRYIIYLSILFFVLSVGVLSKNYLFTGDENSGNPRIAQISILKNNVRRKFDSSLIWYNSKNKDILFENDWIYTGSDSSVTIAFDDGGKLNLDPNSLVILTRHRGLMKLELQHGSFIADLKENTEITVRKNGKSETITSLAKKIRVTDNVDQLTKLSEEQNAEQKNKPPTPQPQVLAATVKNSFITPRIEKNKILASNNTKAIIPFEWEASQGLDHFKFELSSNKDFSNPIVQKTDNHFLKATIPFLGRVYWKISAQASDGLVTSEIMSFAIKKNTAPLALLPKDNESINTIITQDQEPYVNFEWSDTEEVWTQYEIEISSSSNFSDKTTIAHDSLLGQIKRLPLPHTGIFYWRVRGKSENHEQASSWSQSKKFDFKFSFPKSLPPVVLAKKHIRYYLNSDDYKIIDENKFISLASKKQKIKISWSSKNPASFYKAQISNTDDFSDIIQEQETSENSTEFIKTRLGKAYYRVIPHYNNGNIAPPTTGTVKALLPPPKIITSIQKNNFFNLIWSASPAIDQYEVAYFDHPSEQERQNLYFKTNQVKIKNINNYLSWKVRAVSKETKEALSNFTEIRKIVGKNIASVPAEAAKMPELDFPLIISPAKKKTFLSFDNNPTFVLVRWKYKSKYNNFELEVASDESMQFNLISRKLKKKKTVIRRSFKPGKYYFRIRAVNNHGPGDWSPTQIFRVVKNKAE